MTSDVVTNVEFEPEVPKRAGTRKRRYEQVLRDNPGQVAKLQPLSETGNASHWTRRYPEGFKFWQRRLRVEDGGDGQLWLYGRYTPPE